MRKLGRRLASAKSGSATFKQGDAVVHPFHGAGILTDSRTCRVGGVERQYHCIELANGEGTLMIPVDRAVEAGLCIPTSDLHTISSVLLEDPHKLPTNYVERHSQVTAKLHSGDTQLVAEALRDLAWREQQVKLSMIDQQHRRQAHRLLADILALQPNLDAHTADQLLKAALQRAIQAHLGSRAAQIGE